MEKEKIIETAWQKIEPILKNNNMELVDIEWSRKNGSWTLIVYIDKDAGITIVDCEIISREISDLFDRIDFISSSYVLEVSSPGLNRPIKKIEDFRRFTGEFIKIKTEKPVEGQKKFKGKLLALHVDDAIIIEPEKGQEIVIAHDNIEKANLWFHPLLAGNPKGGIKKK